MANVNGGAGLVPFICTQCGAHLDRDPQSETVICGYCGTKFHFAKEAASINVQSASVKHVNSVNIIKKGAVESVLSFVENQQNKKAEEERRKLEEETRRLEEQKRKEEEDKKRAIAFLKKHKWPLLLIAVILIALFVWGINSYQKARVDYISVSVSSDDLKGENYKDAIEELKDAGFTNIQTKVKDDLIIGWLTKDGEVEQVEIDGYTTYASDSRFAPDVEIIVTYHTFPGKETQETEAANSEETIAAATVQTSAS